MSNGRTTRTVFWRSTAIVTLAALGVTSPALAQSTDLGSEGFSISFGDDVVAGATPPPVRTGRAPADELLRRANVNVQFDTLSFERRLNVLTDDLRGSFEAGETVTFRTSSNYPVFIDRAEVVILDRSRPGQRVIATLPADINGTVDWVMPEDAPERLGYVLRVYDAQGRFDETIPAQIVRGPALDPDLNGPFIEAGEGEDRTSRRGIPVRGGTVIVSGTGAEAGRSVRVMGEDVPVDDSGRFTVSRILPVGDQVVEVNANGTRILRDVEIPESDWFATGILDITAGDRDDALISEDGGFVDGRAAFYVSGRTAGGLQVIASADTLEGPIEDAFSRLDDRDPLRILDSIREDGTELYPTYGDDSQYFDSTPTSGNVYLRVESDTVRLTFGDFETGIQGPGLLTHTRDLYGLELAYRTPDQTENGEARGSFEGFVAAGDTLPQRDVLRGTSGSVYFLSRREILRGSTTLSVQVRDVDTGFVISNRTLLEGRDYRVDHLQGVIILTEPLSSGTGDGTVVTDAGDEREINLIAQYEFLPNATDLDDASAGGRSEVWVTENLRFGVTAIREVTEGDPQRMGGVDLRYEFGDYSYIEAEVAISDGPGFGRTMSTDGGLTLDVQPGTGSDSAFAGQIRGDIDFADLGLGVDGLLQFYYENREQGFDTLSEATPDDQQIYGLSFDVAVTDRVDLGFSVEGIDRDSGENRIEGEVSLDYRINDVWSVAVGLGYLDQDIPGNADDTGTRTDAAVRLTYAPSEDLELFGFVQGTLDTTGGLEDNDRAGIGFAADLNERWSASGEISDGDDGTAGELALSYRPSEYNEIYFGYSLDPTRPGEGRGRDGGRFVLGTAYRYSDQLSTFSETIYDRPRDQISLTQAYGVTYTPSRALTFSGGIETGDISDDVDGDFQRVGLSFGAAWTPSEEQAGRLRVEFRTEDGEGVTRDRDTVAVTAGYTTRVADDWRLTADLDLIFSDSEEAGTLDAEYLRAALGYAYRPIDNERLNLLFSVIYLEDLPSADQLTFAGSTDGPEQRSTIISAAANYDLSERLTLSSTVGYRRSEVAPRGTGDFVDDTATLGVLRVDWHALDKWDILAEGRILYTEETGTEETGALLGVYRHLNENVSLGVGYEFGSVSSDLADIDYDAQGVFVNLVARF
ncbi:MAG: hypothetical protein AAF376_03915 [Pseudomonadota bacterium]